MFYKTWDIGLDPSSFFTLLCPVPLLTTPSIPYMTFVYAGLTIPRITYLDGQRGPFIPISLGKKLHGTNPLSIRLPKENLQELGRIRIQSSNGYVQSTSIMSLGLVYKLIILWYKFHLITYKQLHES